MKNVQRRILNILISFDQFVFSLVTLGWAYPDETISSAVYRYEQKGHRLAIMLRPIIDFLFLPLEKDHCYNSYLSEYNRTHLPKKLEK